MTTAQRCAAPSGEHLAVIVKRSEEDGVHPSGWYLLDELEPNVFRYTWRPAIYGLRDHVGWPVRKDQPVERRTS